MKRVSSFSAFNSTAVLPPCLSKGSSVSFIWPNLAMLRGWCWLDENYQEDGKVWNKISGPAGAGIDVVAGDGEDKRPKRRKYRVGLRSARITSFVVSMGSMIIC